MALKLIPGVGEQFEALLYGDPHAAHMFIAGIHTSLGGLLDADTAAGYGGLNENYGAGGSTHPDSRRADDGTRADGLGQEHTTG